MSVNFSVANVMDMVQFLVLHLICYPFLNYVFKYEWHLQWSRRQVERMYYFCMEVCTVCIQKFLLNFGWVHNPLLHINFEVHIFARIRCTWLSTSLIYLLLTMDSLPFFLEIKNARNRWGIPQPERKTSFDLNF